MPLSLRGEKTFQVVTGSNADIVIAAIDIPAGCTLRNVSIPVSMIGVTPAIEREQAVGYAAAAYVFPVEDPDTRVNYDTLWDRFVPKYTDADIIDLDTTGSIASPFWEPGEASFEDIWDMGTMPTKVFGRKKLLTFADPGSAGFRFQPAETPFEPQWFPADKFHVRMNRPIRAKSPSVFLLAVASPAYDDTVTTRSQLGEQDWGQIQYAEATLERALMDQLVLTEAGATTPWIEASDVLRSYLAPNVLEITSGLFITASYNVYGTCTWTLDVPGHLSLEVVDLTP